MALNTNEAVEAAPETNTPDTSADNAGSAEGSVTVDPVVVDPESAVDVDADPNATPEAGAAGSADPAAAAFVPNFKVKVMDKEHEIPEAFRGLIKDAKSQAEVTDIITKALGFEQSKRQYPQMKQQQEKLQTDLQAVSSRYAQVEQGYKRLEGYLEKGDLQSFLGFWKIPKEKLLRHAAELLRYDEMSDAERAEVDRQRHTATLAENHGIEAQTYRQQAFTAQAQVREMQLDQGLGRADIATIAQQFDTRAGQPGAFKARVVRTAQMHAITTRKDISVDQAIQETMAELGFDLVDENAPANPASQPKPAAATPAAKTLAPVQQKKLPVLPTGSASGASPVKRAFNSVADLEKERERLAAK